MWTATAQGRSCSHRVIPLILGITIIELVAQSAHILAPLRVAPTRGPGTVEGGRP